MIPIEPDTVKTGEGNVKRFFVWRNERSNLVSQL